MSPSLSPLPITTPLIRIAVLEADIKFTKYGGYRGLYTSLLQAAADSLGWPRDRLEISAWDVVNWKEGQLRGYPDLGEVDAVLISGSAYSAYENDAWMLRLVEFTKEVLAQKRVRLIGVCFGHQIVGRALGAPVARSEKGFELSVVELNLTARGKELFDGKEILRVMSMHRDIVVDNPAAAGALHDLEPLGSTSHSENQAMYQTRRLITIQGHPEFDEGIMTELLKKRRALNIISEQEFENAMARVGNAQDGLVVGKAFLRFLVDDED
ncbi:hypothetical protein MMC22_009644 [Lobaria immixta]|nr:hypothetical protein [Lobaria immixta]